MLATCTLYNAFISGRTGPGRIFPPPNIYCYPMKENAIRVAWGVEEMGDRGVDKIIVKARAVNGTGHNRTEKVYAGAAQVTLEDLTPETLYRVSMDAYRNGTLIFGSERFIKTWPAERRRKDARSQKVNQTTLVGSQVSTEQTILHQS
ncbi:hypothetical protein ECG_09677 [Echinococcus granulosus]|nr:hypothetical protein ECG_09677 [Echinococcus granulosus]